MKKIVVTAILTLISVMATGQLLFLAIAAWDQVGLGKIFETTVFVINPGFGLKVLGLVSQKWITVVVTAIYFYVIVSLVSLWRQKRS